MPKNSIKKTFSGCFGPFLLEEGPNNLVRGLFSRLDIGPYILPTCGPLHTFLGSFGVAQKAKNSVKKLFTACLGIFLLKEWA
jgi:hypothetical protein